MKLITKLGCTALIATSVALAGCASHQTQPTAKDLTFAFASSKIDPSLYPTLNMVAQKLKENPTWDVRVAGYTDYYAKDKYNVTLSERRADNVADYLKSQGVASSRIHVKAYGDNLPLKSNYTAANRTENRRVEITYFPK